MDAEEVLTTTRAVRKRLDLSREVARETVLECLAIAQQAPSAGNREGWHFVVIDDPRLKAGLADLYRRSIDIGYGASPPRDAEARRALAERQSPGDVDAYVRQLESVGHLYDHLQDVPVHVIPCVPALPLGTPPRGFELATRWGSVMQGTWSFMLAARSRGLGTVWTTAHLRFESEAAELLGIPGDDYMQAGLIPVAHTLGGTFKPGPRRPLDRIVHFDRW
jgi:nitroreductase